MQLPVTHSDQRGVCLYFTECVYARMCVLHVAQPSKRLGLWVGYSVVIMG